MKVLRSKCRTRVIFAKGEQNAITRKLSDISAVQLVNGEIQFLDNNSELIVSANWEAVDIPETFTALEKVIHLNEWLACDEDDCGLGCKDYYYEDYVNTLGFDIAEDENGYDDHYILPFRFDFPDDLSCKSVWEVHVGFTCHSDFESASNGQLVAFLDKEKVNAAISYFQIFDTVTSHNASLHFMFEGDVSGRELRIGVAHDVKAAIPLTEVNATFIVRKVR